jgi:MFS family permease
LHGVCFDFFFVTGQLYTDKKASREIQAQAQGLISLITFGLGWFAGSLVAGKVVDMYTITEVVDSVEKIVGHDWGTIWIYPSIMAIVIMIFFQLFFKDQTVVGRESEEQIQPEK